MLINSHDHRLHHILNQHPRLPVAAVHNDAEVDALVERLRQHRIGIVEITLRTSHGVKAIQRIKREYSDFIVAAGTVLDCEQLSAAADAGADFIVSPGYFSDLSPHASQLDIPLLPGVMTPSEVMAARRAGHRLMKLFPAHAAGGLQMLKSLAGPFPDVMFCPTGGIDAQQLECYLQQKNVIAVGASWLAHD